MTDAQSKFGEISDEEAVLIAMGLTMLLMDALMGAVSGQPWPADALVDKFPRIVGLMNSLGERFDVQIDEALVAQANAVIARQAQASNN